MQYKESIKGITDEILCDEINYQSLRNKLQDFKLLLLGLTKLDSYEPINRADIYNENGISLNTTDAAMCVVDIMRTRQFVRGIFDAVKQVQSKKSFPVRIMYAGTGPFATLILPLLTKYRSDELQLILMEVNDETRTYLDRLIVKLGLEEYVEKIISEDASKYKLDEADKVDILISETMQHGLVKEQQVPIMLNLVNQLDDDVIVIPQKIKLDLALMNTSTDLMFNNEVELRFKFLKTVLEFDKTFMLNHEKKKGPKNRIELCKELQFKEEGDVSYDKLVMLTSIQVFGEEWISVDSSSLTIPKTICKLDRTNESKKVISMDYVIKELPDFEYELN
jgi:hypothetical protein